MKSDLLVYPNQSHVLVTLAKPFAGFPAGACLLMSRANGVPFAATRYAGISNNDVYYTTSRHASDFEATRGICRQRVLTYAEARALVKAYGVTVH